MSDKYFAIGSIGTFLPNDEVVGLDDDRLAELLELGKVRVEQGEKPKQTNKKTDKE